MTYDMIWYDYDYDYDYDYEYEYEYEYEYDIIWYDMIQYMFILIIIDHSVEDDGLWMFVALGYS